MSFHTGIVSILRVSVARCRRVTAGKRGNEKQREWTSREFFSLVKTCSPANEWCSTDQPATLKMDSASPQMGDNVPWRESVKRVISRVKKNLACSFAAIFTWRYWKCSPGEYLWNARRRGPAKCFQNLNSLPYYLVEPLKRSRTWISLQWTKGETKYKKYI